MVDQEGIKKLNATVIDPQVKADWVAALRSGDYQQGNGRLCRPGIGDIPETHCCLGVLGRVVGLQTEELGRGYLFKNEDAHLVAKGYPKDLMEFDTADGETMEPGAPNILAGLNDSGRSFSDIADVIEKHLGTNYEQIQITT